MKWLKYLECVYQAEEISDAALPFCEPVVVIPLADWRRLVKLIGDLAQSRETRRTASANRSSSPSAHLQLVVIPLADWRRLVKLIGDLRYCGANFDALRHLQALTEIDAILAKVEVPE